MSFDLRPPRRRPFLRRGAEAFEEHLLRVSGRYCFLQDDQAVANAPGATVRADINNNLQALVTLSSGASAPSTSWAYQLWADTTNGLLKQRNAANSAWLVRGTLAETFVLARSSNTILGVGDYARTFNCTSTFTQTLTAAATLTDGWWCEIRNNGTGVITVDPNGAETIDGATTIEIPPGCGCIVNCNGSAFTTIGLPRRRAETLPGGRLSLTTALAVTTADVTGATTVYYTPHVSDTIELYDGVGGWTKYQYTELSQATSDNTKSPAAVGASSVYDVFCWMDAGTLRATRGPAWSSDTSRGTGAGTTELELFEGRWVNKIAITNGPAARRGVYLGSIRSDASSQINDSLLKRHVWNMYNRKVRTMRAVETTDSWNYTTATYRQMNAAAGNQLDYLVGLNEDAVGARAHHTFSNASGAQASVGVGVDSTSVNSAVNGAASSAASGTMAVAASYVGYPGLGRHFLAALEWSQAAGTTTFYGDNGGTVLQSGITGEVMA